MLPRRLLPIALPMLFGTYALEFGTISLLPLITNRLNVAVSVGSVFMAVFTLLIAVSGPILTLFSSQIRGRKFLIAALFIVAAGNVFSAYATDILSLMAARLVPALIHPMLFPAVFALAISLYPRREKTFAIFLGVAGAAAGLVLSVPLAAFLGAKFSFSFTFLMFAAFNTACGLVLIWTSPPKPRYSAIRLKHSDRRRTSTVRPR
jgi:DHA1 family inner membrane transport protein